MAFIGNTNTTQAFTPAIDYFSGNASTTAFTLSRPVASVAQVQVVIENVAQNPGSAFTVLNNTITFTSAPPSGTNNIYVYYTSPITQVVTPSDGSVTASVLATNAVTTVKVLDANITPAKLSQPFTSGTAVASTSGTSIDFTGIPSWVKRITLILNGVSMSGTASALIQAGTGSTTYTTSGYLGSYAYFSNGGTPTTAQSTSGFTVFTNNATYVVSGLFVLTNITGNNWVGAGTFTTNNASTTNFQNWNAGSIALGAALTAIRITSAGADTFDAGSINIMYEG